MPIYAVGGTWLIYALLFPMYRWLDYLIVTVLSVITYMIMSFAIPPKTELVESKPELVDTGNAIQDEQLHQWQLHTYELTKLRQKVIHADIGDKLDSIIVTSKQMLELLKEDTRKFRHVRTFSTYYFPTVTSLIRRYYEYEESGKQGPNMIESMHKIETATGMIEQAFQTALDRLYRDEKLETEVEVEVLEQMLLKDGLSDVVKQDSNE